MIRTYTEVCDDGAIITVWTNGSVRVGRASSGTLFLTHDEDEWRALSLHTDHQIKCFVAALDHEQLFHIFDGELVEFCMGRGIRWG